MVPPVRWFHLLSTWIFILSALYPLHGISTFPLNILASVGCFEPILNPHKESMVKNIYIILLHILAFIWIPYEFSTRTLTFALCVIIAYLIFVECINENPFHIYAVLLDEDHPTAQEFLCDRFGIYCDVK